MTLLRADKTTVLKEANIGTVTDDVPSTKVLVLEDIWETFHEQGSSSDESGLRLAFYSGQVVALADFTKRWGDATVTTISPATGLLAAGGQVVTITGTNLRGVTGVLFGVTAGTTLVKVSNTQIKITTPAKTAGAYDVVVQDDAGDVTVDDGATFV